MLKYLQTSGKMVLIALAILTLSMSYFLKDLTFSYDFERFFPKGDPELSYYLDYREKFESDNDFLFITILHSKGIFDQEFLIKISELTDSLSSVDNIVSVQSPSNLSNVIFGPFGAIEIPYIHIDQPIVYPDDSVRIWNEKHLIGSFFAANAKAVTIFIKHTQNLSKKKCDRLLSSIEELVDSKSFEKVYYAGRIHGQQVYIQKIQTEMLLFLCSSFILVCGFLWLSFKRIRWIVIPLIVILATMLWTFICMAFNGQKLEVISTLLPTILFVVGVSDSVHLISRYFDVRHGFMSNMEALKACFKEIGLATFLTSLTTAVGFASLAFVRIEPVQTFGLYAALGVGIAFVLTYIIVPAFLLILKPTLKDFTLKDSLRWRLFLNKSFIFILRKRKWIGIGAICLTLLISASVLRFIDMDQYLLEDISDQDPLKQGYVYHEEHFSGARPFELGIELNNHNVWDLKTVQQIDSVSSYLSTKYGVNMLLSYVEILKKVHRAKNGGSIEYERIPETQDELDALARIIKKQNRILGLTNFVSTDQKTVRIAGKMKDIGAKACAEKTSLFYDFIDQSYFSGLNISVTGMGHLIDKNNQYLIQNMLQGLFFSMLIISIIMFLLFKDVLFIVISLIPNILPLLFVGAFMSLFGIRLNVSTSIIFTIAFGIAVDDTIHFLMKYRLQKTNNVLWAVRNTFLHSGKAIIITTLILSGGFITLIFSTFSSVFNTGLLVSLTLLFAVIADLMVLPILILYLKQKRK